MSGATRVLKRACVALAVVVVGWSAAAHGGIIKATPVPKWARPPIHVLPVVVFPFDGKTLDGWEVRSGFAKFHVEDRAIVGTTVPGSPNTFLCTREEFGDFELKFDVKVDRELNSGVQFRSHAYPEDTVMTLWRDGKQQEHRHKSGRVYGYQVEIAGGTHSGSVYDEARLATWLCDASGDPNARAAFKDGQWNQVRMVCSGDHIRSWVNGVPCADFYDPTDQTGFIGLQVHGYQGDKPAQVRWRNIVIKPQGRHIWKPVFEEDSLEGWTATPGGRWEMRDGVLVGTNDRTDPRHGLLVCDWPMEDFCVRFSFKAVKGNSGFYFRSEQVAGDVGVHGLQAEIDAARDVGGLYETGGRGWVVQPGAAEVERWFRPGQWNTMTVSAHGDRIAVYVNGCKTAETAKKPKFLPGHFAFQLHGGQDVEVYFKDVQILGWQYAGDD